MDFRTIKNTYKKKKNTFLFKPSFHLANCDFNCLIIYYSFLITFKKSFFPGHLFFSSHPPNSVKHLSHSVLFHSISISLFPSMKISPLIQMVQRRPPSGHRRGRLFMIATCSFRTSLCCCSSCYFTDAVRRKFLTLDLSTICLICAVLWRLV